MAKAVFIREFHWNRKTKGRGVDSTSIGFGARPNPEPQNFPQDFVDAAVKAGAAKEVKSQKKT